MLKKGGGLDSHKDLSLCHSRGSKNEHIHFGLRVV